MIACPAGGYHANPIRSGKNLYSTFAGCTNFICRRPLRRRLLSGGLTNKEFEPFRSFKVHDLEVLLKLSGYEQVIKSQQFPEWSKVRIWQPEIRYRPIGFITQQQAGEMLNATFSLMSQL